MKARLLIAAALLLPGCVTLRQHENEIDAERLRCAERRSQEMGTVTDRHAAEMARKDAQIHELQDRIDAAIRASTPVDSGTPESMPYPRPSPSPSDWNVTPADGQQ